LLPMLAVASMALSRRLMNTCSIRTALTDAIAEGVLLSKERDTLFSRAWDMTISSASATDWPMAIGSFGRALARDEKVLRLLIVRCIRFSRSRPAVMDAAVLS